MSGDSTWELVRSKERVVVVGNCRSIRKYKKGIVINLTRKGPIIGTMAIKAPKPAKTCVNIPNITV